MPSVNGSVSSQSEMATEIISRAHSTASQKLPLPHVSTLWQSTESSTNRNTFDARKTLSSQRNLKQISEPSSPKRTSLDLRNTPNIHLLEMPDIRPGEFQSTHHRGANSPETHSPSSTHAASIQNGSLFELPTIANESPISSIRTCEAAELEDTSGLNDSSVPPLPTKFTPPTDTSVLFNTNKITSRAILKVVDETIAGIEAANRELLARAEAAEASAYRLHVSNTELRSRVEELSMHYRPKPVPITKPVGTQTSPRNTPRHTPNASTDKSGDSILLDRASLNRPSGNFARAKIQGTPTFHNMPQVEPSTEPGYETTPKSHFGMRGLKFLQRSHAEAFSMPNSNASASKLNHARASPDRPRTADATVSSPSHPTIPPMPELPNFLSFSSHPIHGGKHSRTISFEEARKLTTLQIPVTATVNNSSANLTRPTIKRPLGEMSPSPICGVVEIGLGIQEGDERDGAGDKHARPLRSQRSRVRLLLKENVLRELLENGGSDKEKKKNQREGNMWKETIVWAENMVADVGEKRKKNGFWKRGKKVGEVVPVA